jgi:hypothetical protein
MLFLERALPGIRQGEAYKHTLSVHAKIDFDLYVVNK